MQMGMNYAQAKPLSGFLVATMAFLLAKQRRRKRLDMLKHIENGITEKLGKYQRTDGNTEFSGQQMLRELRRIGNRTLFKALRSGIKDGLWPLSYEITPGLKLYESSQVRADLPGQICLHQLHLSPVRWKRQHLTATLHGREIEIGQHHLVGGATERN
jgi:hypothetical protein